ncbi:hypothetical protein IEQ34_016202 [Dendrobium chrysotoxum]|uniref:Uncharacterized protein n=1 Tax=Dendrobium chrysotoxum TaxID=161865 RepID=A0AAV7GFV3_DENCH|nr:hypothetical protein IEQ34_016202 [Dendrobium chrysotoxum]
MDEDILRSNKFLTILYSNFLVKTYIGISKITKDQKTYLHVKIYKKRAKILTKLSIEIEIDRRPKKT